MRLPIPTPFVAQTDLATKVLPIPTQLSGFHIPWETLSLWAVRAVVALTILVSAWLVASWIRAAIKRGTSRARLDPTLSSFLANATKWAILTLAALTALEVFNVQPTSFAAILAAMGLAIGLAFQGTLSNIASGVLILVFRPFKLGDNVVIAGQSGNVSEIDLFTTALDTPDGRRVIVPNAQIAGAAIENQSHHPKRRAEILLNVAFDASPAATRNALAAAARDALDCGGLSVPPPEVTMTDFGKASVQWAVRVWAPTTRFGEVRTRMLESAKRELDQAGIRLSAT
jgi:small conductance mechanosensitive channel